MKVALVMVALIGLIVFGLPFSVVGDGSQSGAVQSFMSFGLNATGLLLGLLTIFLSRSVADEFVHRQIFLVMTKPVARWQYVIGKWLGIVMLDGVFLLGSGLTIYGMVHYIKSTHPPIDDRFDEFKLNNEVLVARHALKCTPPDFRVPAKAEFERNLEEGMYDDYTDFNAKDIQRSLTKKYEAQWRVVGPSELRVFEFSNVLCNRSKGSEIQIRYKTDVSAYPPDEVFRAEWQVGDSMKGTPVYRVPVRHVIGRFHSVAVPADAVADDHTLAVYFSNKNPFEGEPQYKSVIEFRKSSEVEVLFVVGSFEGNLLRLLTLIMCKLMFLAAVAILMTAVFSFPVACLASLTVYVLAGTRAFILEAMDTTNDEFAGMFSSLNNFFAQSMLMLYDALHKVIPDFGYYNAIEDFVNGRNVSLVWVLDGMFWLVFVKTSIVLGVAILLFHRREVAEISV